MSDKIRIILVDHYSLFRRGFTELLTRRYDMEVVGTTDNGEELTSLLLKHQIDLVVMGLRMEPVNGLGLLSIMRKDGYLTPVLILTMSDAESDLAHALRAGVRGYLLKNMPPDDVVESIRRVVAGEFVIAPAMTTKMIGILQNRPHEQGGNNPMKSLTDREHEILQLVALGGSNKAIAITLGISNETVKQHIHHIFTKLNLSSRVEAAVKFAVQKKLCIINNGILS